MKTMRVEREVGRNYIIKHLYNQNKRVWCQQPRTWGHDEETKQRSYGIEQVGMWSRCIESQLNNRTVITEQFQNIRKCTYK